MFVAFYPQLQSLNIMNLATPQSAILSAIIFNALIIVALIPLALRGVAYRPVGAASILRRNLLVYGFGGIIPSSASSSSTFWSARLAWLEDKHLALRKTKMINHLRPAIMLTVLMTALTGLAYPLAMTGLAGRLFPYQANGSLIERDGKIIGSELIGQNFTSDGYFHGRPSATTDTDPNDSTKTVPAPYNASNSGGSNYGPTSKALVDRVKDDSGPLAATNPSAKIPVDLVTTRQAASIPILRPPPLCSRFRGSPQREAAGG
jgi:K+-transporting ATPase ATPase C chain